MLNKQKMGFLLVTVLIASFALGYIIADIARDMHINKEQKPVINMKKEASIIEAKTPVIFEKEYSLSNEVVISEFEHKQDIIGKTLDEIRSEFTTQNGFNISLQNSNLVIHQKINDWSPADKQKYRLKVYKGMLAVYQGPNSENDSLLRVTAIRVETLPPSIQDLVKQGKYEFDNEEALNDALENLDEYE